MEVPPAPLPYKLREWARAMGVSYPDIYKVDASIIKNFLDMQELEQEYGIPSAEPPPQGKMIG